MKEMEYQVGWLDPADILDEGKYRGHKYVIVSYGDHPCAYVKASKKINCDKIRVHGGITFADKLEHIYGENADYYIGWDYAHGGDYVGFYLHDLVAFREDHFDGLKRWTTAEIFEDVKSVIDQIKCQKRSRED